MKTIQTFIFILTSIIGFTQDYKIRTGSFDYKNGEDLYEYTGEYIKVGREKLPHGQGTLRKPDLSHEKLVKKGYATLTYSYAGLWEEGKKHGEGVESYGSPSAPFELYSGNFNLDKRSGQGKVIYGDPIPYSGTKRDYFSGDLYLIKSYEGEWLNDSITGIGKLLFDNGISFTGSVLNSVPNGEGTLRYTDGSILKGTWSDFKFSGKGKKKYDQLNTKGFVGEFEGEWNNGKWTKGEFKWIFEDGSKNHLAGGWNEDLFTGEFYIESNKGQSSLKGKLLNNKQDSIWIKNQQKSKDKSIGFFKYDIFKSSVGEDENTIEGYIIAPLSSVLHGKGERNISNGRHVFTGQFVEGEITIGKWTEDYKSEEGNREVSYEGSFKKWKPHGVGIMEKTEDWTISVYEGEWKDGKKSGSGKEEAANEGFNSKYDGEWSNDVKSGFGTVIYEVYDYERDETCKTTYNGSFENDLPNGIGVEKNCDGSTYEGQFVNGTKNGNGVLTKSNGQKHTGLFIDGEYQKPFVCKTQKIGGNIWMTENLSIKRFRNGDIIEQAKNEDEWRVDVPRWAYAGFDENSGVILYNYKTIMDPRQIAPHGYRVPNLFDMMDLVNSQSNVTVFNVKTAKHAIEDYSALKDELKKVETKLKSSSGWKNHERGNNLSKFNAKPTGKIVKGLGNDGWPTDFHYITKPSDQNSFNIWLSKDGVNPKFWKEDGDIHHVYLTLGGDINYVHWVQEEIYFSMGAAIRLIKEQ